MINQQKEKKRKLLSITQGVKWLLKIRLIFGWKNDMETLFTVARKYPDRSFVMHIKALS